MIQKKYLFLLLFIFFTSCPYQYNILICGDEPYEPKFVFVYKNSNDCFQGVEQPLEKFDIYMVDDKDNVLDTVWSFKLEGHDIKKIRKIRYGHLPAGYEEIIKASKLIPQKKYMVLSRGMGAFGYGEFSISN